MSTDITGRNPTARSRQLKKPDPQPYHKLVLDSKRACPFCDTILRKVESSDLWGQECACSIWTMDQHPASFHWTRQAKADTIPDTN